MLQNNCVTLYKVTATRATQLSMKKSERLGLVLTPAEKKVVATLARSRGGLSNSALIRCLIHEAARTAGLFLDEPTSSAKQNE